MLPNAESVPQNVPTMMVGLAGASEEASDSIRNPGSGSGFL
jgi:hypothetical protein